MPLYLMLCENTACPALGQKIERLAHAQDRDRLCCGKCKRKLGTHPDQFATIAVQRPWTHGGRGCEGESKAMVFQEKGIPEIKRDCPSMDFVVKNGEATPVFHNDAHHRACMGQLKKAKGRYEGELKAEKRAARARDKAAFMSNRRKSRAGIT